MHTHNEERVEIVKNLIEKGSFFIQLVGKEAMVDRPIDFYVFVNGQPKLITSFSGSIRLTGKKGMAVTGKMRNVGNYKKIEDFSLMEGLEAELESRHPKFYGLAIIPTVFIRLLNP